MLNLQDYTRGLRSLSNMHRAAREASEERLEKLEAGLRRAHEDLEACAVLLLSLEGGRAEPDARLTARVDVLEEAWALRSGTLGQRAEESVGRVEQEVGSPVGSGHVFRSLRFRSSGARC